MNSTSLNQSFLLASPPFTVSIRFNNTFHEEVAPESYPMVSSNSTCAICLNATQPLSTSHYLWTVVFLINIVALCSHSPALVYSGSSMPSAFRFQHAQCKLFVAGYACLKGSLRPLLTTIICHRAVCFTGIASQREISTLGRPVH